MSFGKYSYGNPNIIWQNDQAKLVIGNFCSIASNYKELEEEIKRLNFKRQC
jgi:hypothetical protein